jgi:hypothetical protein
MADNDRLAGVKSGTKAFGFGHHFTKHSANLLAFF